MADFNLGAEVSMDVDPLKASRTTLERNLKAINKSLKDQRKEFKQNEVSAEGLANKEKDLGRAIRLQEGLLKKRKDTLSDLDMQLRKSNKVTDEQKLKLQNASRAVQQAENQLSGYQNELKQTQTSQKLLGRSTDEVKNSLGQLKRQAQMTDLTFKQSSKSTSDYQDHLQNLNRTMEKQGAHLKLLKGNLKEVERSQGMNSRAANKLRNDVAKEAIAFQILQGRIHETRDELGKLQRQQALGTSLAKSWQGMREQMDRIATTLRSIGEIGQGVIQGVLITNLSTLVPILGSVVSLGAGLGGMLTAMAGGAIGMAGAFGIAGGAAITMGAMSKRALTLLEDGVIKNTTQVNNYKTALSGIKTEFDTLVQSNQSAIFTTMANGINAARFGLNQMAPAISKVSSVTANASGQINDWIRNSQNAKNMFSLLNQTGPKVFNNILQAVLKFGDGTVAIFNKMNPLFTWASQGFENMAKSFQKWANSAQATNSINGFIDYTKTNLPIVGRIFGNVFGGIVGLFKAFSGHSHTVLKGMEGVTQSFKDWANNLQGTEGFKNFLEYLNTNGPKVWEVVKNITQTIWGLIKGMAPVGAVMLNITKNVTSFTASMTNAHPIIGKVVGVITAVGGAAFLLAKGAFAGLSTAISVANLLFKVSRGQMALSAVMAGKYSTATKIAAAASRGLGLAIRFMTGPVGLIITAIGAFVAIIIHLWKTNDTFRNAVIGIWNKIKSGVMAVVNALKVGIPAAWSLIKKVTLTIWNGIKSAVVSLVKALATGVRIYITAVKTVVSTVFNTAKTIAIKVWTTLKAGVITIAKTLWTGVRNTFNALKNGVNSIFNSVKNFAIKVWTTIKNGVIKAAKLLWSGVKTNFNNLKRGITIIFNAVKNFAIKVWTTIKNRVVSFAKSLWSGVRNTFNALRKGVSSIFNGVKNISIKVWTTIKNRVTSFARSLWSGVKNTFNSLKTGVSNIFNSVKNSAIKVWNTIKNKLTGIASSIWGSVKKTFNNMKNGLKGIIDKIKEHITGMTKAVRNGLQKLIDGVNWVGKKLSMPKIPDLPKLHTGTEHTHTTKNVVKNGKISRDTFATVGDRGKGNGPGGFRHETIRYPNGKMAITPNKDTTAFLPQGSSVMNGAQTHAMLSNNPQFSKGTLPRFASGTKKKKDENLWDKTKNIAGDFGEGVSDTAHGIKENTQKALEASAKAIGKGKKWLGDKVGDVMDWVGKPGKLLNNILDAFGVNMNAFGISKDASLPFDMMKGMFGKLKDAAKNLIKGWMEDAAVGEGDAAWLLKHDIWQKFGNYTGGLGFNGGKHYGVDFGMTPGTNVKAVAGGKVSKVWNDYGGGKSIEIDIGKGLTNQYMHLSKQLVKKGQRVGVGDLIAKSGNTGNFTAGSGHLHFQLNKKGVPQSNVLEWLKGLGGGGKKSPSKWKSTIKKAAKKMKVNLSGSELNGIVAQIQRESNGDAGVTQGNIGDINNLRGTPAQGLLQYVPSTFKSYAMKGHTNIKSGYDQLLAFFNNKNWRRDLPYGKSGWGPTGGRRFAKGTSNAPRGLAQVFEEGGEIMNMRGGESIIPNDVSVQAFKQMASSDIFNKTQSAVYEGISRYADAIREKKAQATREQQELQRLSRENSDIKEQNGILKETLSTMQAILASVTNIESNSGNREPITLDGDVIEKSMSRKSGRRAGSTAYENGGAWIT